MKTAVDIIVELQQQYMKTGKVTVKDINDKIDEYAEYYTNEKLPDINAYIEEIHERETLLIQCIPFLDKSPKGKKLHEQILNLFKHD